MHQYQMDKLIHTSAPFYVFNVFFFSEKFAF